MSEDEDSQNRVVVLHGNTNNPEIIKHKKEILKLFSEIFYDSISDEQAEKVWKNQNKFWILILWANKPISLAILESHATYHFLDIIGVRKHRHREGWGRITFEQIRKFCGNLPIKFRVHEELIDARIFFTRMGCVVENSEDEFVYYIDSQYDNKKCL